LAGGGGRRRPDADPPRGLVVGDQGRGSRGAILLDNQIQLDKLIESKVWSMGSLRNAGCLVFIIAVFVGVRRYYA